MKTEIKNNVILIAVISISFYFIIYLKDSEGYDSSHIFKYCLGMYSLPRQTEEAGPIIKNHKVNKKSGNAIIVNEVRTSPIPSIPVTDTKINEPLVPVVPVAAKKDAIETFESKLPKQEDTAALPAITDNTPIPNVTPLQINEEENISQIQETVTPPSAEVIEEPVKEEVKAIEPALPVSYEIPDFKLLSPEEFQALAKDNPFVDSIKKYGQSTDDVIKKELLKNIINIPVEQKKILIDLIRAQDSAIVRDASYFCGLLNFTDAIPYITGRIKITENESLVQQLFSSLGMMKSDAAAIYLNEAFNKQESLPVLRTIMECLHGYADPQSIQRCFYLISGIKDKTFIAETYHLLASIGMTDGHDFAKENLFDEKDSVKAACLGILSFTGTESDLKIIEENRKLFYKSVQLIQEYLKAKAFIPALNMKGVEGPERYEEIEYHFKNNKPVLAWFAKYIAKKENKNINPWFKNYCVRNDLLNEVDCINALMILGIDPKKITLSQDTAPQTSVESKPEEIKKIVLDCDVKIISDFPKCTLYIENEKEKYSLNIDSSMENTAENTISNVKSGIYSLKVVAPDGLTGAIKVRLVENKLYTIRINDLRKQDFITNSLGMKMKLIPPGEFTMGDSRLNLLEHKVKISNAMWVGIHEVTNTEYETFDPSRKAIRDKRSDKDNGPAIMVEWYKATEFCNWLSNQEKLGPCYDTYSNINFIANGYRLPFEAEWEYFARGNLDKKLYPWGDPLTMDEHHFANYSPRGKSDDDGYSFAAPVGSFSDNEFGLFDMAGNVSEWCNDWFLASYYSELKNANEIAVDPQSPKTGSGKVCRGGSWFSRDAIQVAFRESAHPLDRSNTRGFRICKLAKIIGIEVETPVDRQTAEQNKI